MLPFWTEIAPECHSQVKWCFCSHYDFGHHVKVVDTLKTSNRLRPAQVATRFPSQSAETRPSCAAFLYGRRSRRQLHLLSLWFCFSSKSVLYWFEVSVCILLSGQLVGESQYFNMAQPNSREKSRVRRFGLHSWHFRFSDVELKRFGGDADSSRANLWGGSDSCNTWSIDAGYV